MLRWVYIRPSSFVGEMKPSQICNWMNSSVSGWWRELREVRLQGEAGCDTEDKFSTMDWDSLAWEIRPQGHERPNLYGLVLRSTPSPSSWQPVHTHSWLIQCLYPKLVSNKASFKSDAPPPGAADVLRL